MIKRLRADLMRLKKSFAFRLSLLAMLAAASIFMFMQATSMDYTVPLSRVIFLPMSMYGLAASAFVSTFIGTDFSDGFIRNKLLAANRRSDYVISQIIVSCIACVIIYIVVTMFTFGVGRFFFENDVQGTDFIRLFALGFGMSIVTGCLFSVMTLLCGNKTQAIIWCMGLAFLMLVLAMHTNSVLVQTEYKNGILNPKYIDGFRRTLNSILHDINPYGQASQLSSWAVWHPTRMILLDIPLVCGISALGCLFFQRKDIK